ncbi:MAG: hypothetical protein ABJA82_07135 [Myxococcales bacterium]
MLLAVACTGCPQTQVHALVVGSVVDGTTERPLAGVGVSSHGQKTTTDGDGRYSLDVKVGVRELQFALPDGRSERKYAVARGAGNIRLDVLVPAASAPPPPALLLQRGDSFDETFKDLSFDAGNQFMLSETDAQGNGDRFFAPAWTSQEVESPVWSPTGDAIYFSDRQGVARPDALASRGLQRLDPVTGELTHLWFQASPPESIAVAPDGHALVATDGATVYLFQHLLDPPVTHTILVAPMPGPNAGFQWVAWAPANFIYAGVAEPVDAGASAFRYHIERLSETGEVLEAHVVDDATRPLPLADGGLVYWHGGAGVADPGLRLLENGATRNLMKGDWLFPVAFDRAANALTYRSGNELHRLNLDTGLDLVIVQSVRSASLKPTH